MGKRKDPDPFPKRDEACPVCNGTKFVEDAGKNKYTCGACNGTGKKS